MSENLSLAFLTRSNRFRKKRDCTIYGAKTKAQLICGSLMMRFSHDAAHIQDLLRLIDFNHKSI